MGYTLKTSRQECGSAESEEIVCFIFIQGSDEIGRVNNITQVGLMVLGDRQDIVS